MRLGARWAVAILLALIGFGATFMVFYGAGLPLMPPDDGDRASVALTAGTVVGAAITAWSAWFTADRTVPAAATEAAPIRLDLSHATVSLNGHPAEPTGVLVRMGDLPRRPVGFQPRDDLVAELARTAADHRLAVVRTVTGTRGVGKTQLAAAYARLRIEDGWPVVAWINGETRGQLVSGLAELAAQLGVREAGEDAETSARAALTWIGRADDRCLLVVDNAVDPDEVAGWLPTAGRAEVVVTTTSRAFGNIAAGGQVDVGVFNLAEALAFLRERTGLDDERGAGELAEELGRLPVALAQSAAVISSENIGYRGCLDRLRTMPLAQLLPAVPGERYPHRMAEAVLLSVQQVEAHDDTGVVRVLLDALAVLAPSGVPGALLHAVAERHLPDSGRAATERASGRLVEASLATRMGSDSVAVHRLTQRVLQDRARAEGALARVAALIAECLEEGLIPLPEAWERREEGGQLVDQIDALWNAVGADLVVFDGPCVTALARLRGWMAQYLGHVSESARALDTAEETVFCLETTLDPQAEAVFVALETLARVRAGAGRAEAAVAVRRRLLDLREREHAPDSREMLQARSELAWAHRWAGHFDLSVSLFERLAEDVERLKGPDHGDTIEVQGDLAKTYGAAGRLAEAVAVSEAVRERLMPTGGAAPGRDSGTRDSGTRDSGSRDSGSRDATSRDSSDLSRLVDFYDSAGRAAEGAELLRRLLEEREAGGDRNASETIWIRNRLADNCMSAGLYDEALEAAGRALEDAERLFADDPKSVAAVRETWANALTRLERYAEALAELRRAVADLTALHGPDHPDVLEARRAVVQALANAAQQQNSRLEAAELLADCERLLGTDDTATLRTRSLYADACVEAGQYDEAVTVAHRVVRDAERIHGPGHPWTLGSYLDLADALNTTRSYEEAETLLRRTRERITDSLGARHSLVLRADEVLTKVLLRAGRGQEARELTERTLEARVAQYGADDDGVPWVATTLADIEIGLGDYDRGLARYHEARTMLEHRHGADHQHAIVVRRRTARAYARAWRFPQWSEAISRSVDDCTRFYGADHPWTLFARSEQVDAVRRLGKRRQALRMRRALHEEYVGILGADHPFVIGSLDDLAGEYRAVNRRIKALRLRRRVLALQNAMTGPDSPDSRYACRQLGAAYWSVGLVWKSAAIQGRLLDQTLRQYGPDHPDTLAHLWWRAGSLRACGRIRQSLAMYRTAVLAYERLYGPDHVTTLHSRANEAWALRLTGRVRRAVAAYEALVVDGTRIHGPDHPLTWIWRQSHAYATLWSLHPRRTVTLCVPLFEEGRRIFGSDHPDIRMGTRKFAFLALATGHLRTAVDAYRRSTPQGVTPSTGHPRQ